MARHGDTRSPSPVGSTYSSSRRSRREDDRYERSRRDDGRSYRRSRSPEVCRAHLRDRPVIESNFSVPTQRRYRDRDYGRDRDSYRRHDRSIDPRDEDSYRPSRRDRSRDRRRSRDRDDDRDYRRRSRDRNYRARRDDSCDRDRRRPDDSADLKYKSRREDSRDHGPSRRSRSRTREASKPSTPAPAAPTEEEKRAERLAKLEAWKQKKAAEREKDQKGQPGAAPRNILEAIDRKSGFSPTVSSPQTPTTPADSTTPTAYPGKFDPKAIARNATSSAAAPAVLGTDVAVPQSANAPVKPAAPQPAPVSAPLKA